MFSANRGDVTLPISVAAPPANPTAESGAIGVGTWKTQAEFKDVQVTGPDGTILFASDFNTNSDGWRLAGNGDWQVTDGVLRQSGGNENIRATAGDKSWSDYTLTLKARKLGGSEGFLILFHVNDDLTKNWWNIGGWGNSSHAIELDNHIITQTPGSIETGRWYDIRVEAKGGQVRCYLDGRLVHDLDSQPLKALFASATHDSKTGDIILKVVNGSANPLDTDINLHGMRNPTCSGKAIVLAAKSPLDENSLDDPRKVSPKTDAFSFRGDRLQWKFPANSITVLRLTGK
jgi:alpha-L-arabinofuranosidase